MTLLSLLLTVAIFGFILWLIVTYIPMPAPFPRIIIVVAVIVLLIWLINGFGLLGPMNRPIFR